VGVQARCVRGEGLDVVRRHGSGPGDELTEVASTADGRAQWR
jgi:hypothetical protein